MPVAAALFLVTGGLIAPPFSAQTAAPPAFLSGHDSNPVTLGWMVGSPPPADKLVRFSDSSWFRFPQTRWSFSHIRQLMPTSTVSRGDRPATTLPLAARADIDAIVFQPVGRAGTMTWAESLDANYTDGILVLHRGRIVYERYLGVLTADQPHIAMSVTKSFIGTVAAMLVAEGTLDERATVTRYLPELEGSALADATVRQLLDMTTALDYTENYADPKSPAWDYSRAGGFLARPPGYQGPETFLDYLKTLTKSKPHGDGFAYKTVNTETLGAIMRRASGKSLSALLSERILSRLGMEHDGFFTVDSSSAEFAGAGLNLTLRDMARFGEMMRLDGRYDGRQIVPKAVVDDIRQNGDRAQFAKAGMKSRPGWSYRNKWWVHNNPHGVFQAIGIHGQTVYVDPAAEMVVARFASQPLAVNPSFDATLPAFAAVAGHLMASR